MSDAAWFSISTDSNNELALMPGITGIVMKKSFYNLE